MTAVKSPAILKVPKQSVLESRLQILDVKLLLGGHDAFVFVDRYVWVLVWLRSYWLSTLVCLYCLHKILFVSGLENLPLPLWWLNCTDLHEIARAKFDFDVVGHYSRSELFNLTVMDEPTCPVTFTSTSGSIKGSERSFSNSLLKTNKAQITNLCVGDARTSLWYNPHYWTEEFTIKIVLSSISYDPTARLYLHGLLIIVVWSFARVHGCRWHEIQTFLTVVDVHKYCVYYLYRMFSLFQWS